MLSKKFRAAIKSGSRQLGWAFIAYDSSIAGVYSLGRTCDTLCCYV